MKYQLTFLLSTLAGVAYSETQTVKGLALTNMNEYPVPCKAGHTEPYPFGQYKVNWAGVNTTTADTTATAEFDIVLYGERDGDQDTVLGVFGTRDAKAEVKELVFTIGSDGKSVISYASGGQDEFVGKPTSFRVSVTSLYRKRAELTRAKVDADLELCALPKLKMKAIR